MISRGDVFDVIVIGGGHAGVEAAWAAANVLSAAYRGGEADAPGRVALITMDPAKIGAMSCNPAIGGLAKGQIVREIDALGGLMGLAADATGIQFRMLNASKGAAVRGPRCQSDKYAYAREVQRLIATRDNIEVLSGTVEKILEADGQCTGVVYVPVAEDGPASPSDACCGEFGSIDCADKPIRLHAKTVVLTTGTFMRAIMHMGEAQTPGGRVDEGSAVGISGALQDLGFELGRLKTGTPPRLARESLVLDGLELQPGDEQPTPFSDMTGMADRRADELPQDAALHQAYQVVADRFPVIEQTPCWITHTNDNAHGVIRDNLNQSPMYNGQITTTGPRYCPTIEDKVVRFADRQSHHVFLEPESHESNEVYCNGISTSLPVDVQDRIIRSLPGCENAVVLKYGYAVEYDMVRPHQLDATCMTKLIDGFFTAGQINGTSGYEEAAGQGLIAGLNAARLVLGKDLVRLRRDEAYIGVMLDDLVTKVPVEPYRMFSSRAEHRLMLRADNSDVRLTSKGRELGLVDDDRWGWYQRCETARASLKQAMREVRVEDVSMIEWVRRPGATVAVVQSHLTDHAGLDSLALDRRIVSQVLAELQYAGYIRRHQREIERMAQQDEHPLPTHFDYSAIKGLRNEAVQVLTQFQPATYGQASRLEGVTPADLMVINVALSKTQTQ